jgi:excisionase family DNA binding protein
MRTTVERLEGLAPKALSLSDSARYAGFSKSYIKGLIRDRKLPVVRMGPRAIRVLVSDLDAILEAHRDAA